MLCPTPLHAVGWYRFESPALTLRSLRREVLCLLSASSRSMADPIALLAQALDPPDADVVADALQYLQEVGQLDIVCRTYQTAGPLAVDELVQ